MGCMSSEGRACPPVETLEEYWFRRLVPTLSVSVENHLFVCQRCLEAFEDVHAFITSVGPALERLAADDSEGTRRTRLGALRARLR